MNREPNGPRGVSEGDWIGALKLLHPFGEDANDEAFGVNHLKQLFEGCGEVPVAFWQDPAYFMAYCCAMGHIRPGQRVANGEPERLLLRQEHNSLTGETTMWTYANPRFEWHTPPASHSGAAWEVVLNQLSIDELRTLLNMHGGRSREMPWFGGTYESPAAWLAAARQAGAFGPSGSTVARTWFNPLEEE